MIMDHGVQQEFDNNRRARRASFASRYIPQNATQRPHPDGLGIVYLYSTSKGLPAAVAYAGKQSKAAWHYSFQCDPAREQRIQEWFRSLESWRQAKAERATERTLPHSLNAGDIISNSWGYDQTNVDWYQVTRTSANFVWLRAIGSDVTETGFMCGNSSPRRDCFLEESPEEQHRVNVYLENGQRSQSVNFKYGSGHKWTGGSERASWYA